MISLLKYGKEFAWYLAKKTLSLVIVICLYILLIIYWYFPPNSSSGGSDAFYSWFKNEIYINKMAFEKDKRLNYLNEDSFNLDLQAHP